MMSMFTSLFCKRKDAQVERDIYVGLTVLYKAKDGEAFVIRFPIPARVCADGSIVAAVTFQAIMEASLTTLCNRQK